MTQQWLKTIRSFHQKKYRYLDRRFLVEGEKILEELLLSPKWVIEQLFLSEKGAEQLEIPLKRSGISFTLTTEQKLTQASTFQSASTGIAIVRMPDILPLPTEGDCILLDQLKDPGNVGTILRAADWYGIPYVLCSPNSVDIYNSKVIAASMGSFLRVQIWETDLPTFLKNRKDLHPYAAVMNGKNVHTYALQSPAAWMIGSESHGLSEPLIQAAEESLSIPRFGDAESLNAAMAATILLDNYRRSYPLPFN